MSINYNNIDYSVVLRAFMSHGENKVRWLAFHSGLSYWHNTASKWSHCYNDDESQLVWLICCSITHGHYTFQAREATIADKLAAMLLKERDAMSIDLSKLNERVNAIVNGHPQSTVKKKVEQEKKAAQCSKPLSEYSDEAVASQIRCWQEELERREQARITAEKAEKEAMKAKERAENQAKIDAMKAQYQEMQTQIEALEKKRLELETI